MTAAAAARSWHCVGRVEDLPSPGNWLRAPLTPAGVLVVRDAGGELRAFHATCTHRGAALFDADAPDEGRGETFTCPSHALAFGLDGAACGGPAIVRAACSGGLRPVRVATTLGFVFVTLDEHEVALDEALGAPPPWLGRSESLARGALRRVHRVAYDIDARMSVVLENFQESLHFASVHPALEALTPSERAETWTPSGEAAARGRWLGGIMPLADAAETVSSSARRGSREWLVPEEDRRLVHDALCAPNLLTSLQPDYLLTFVLYPATESRTRVVAATYVHGETPDDAEAIADVTSFWARVYEEDRRACERQERGLRSGGEQRFSAVEEGSAAVAELIAPRARVASRYCGIFGRPYADLSELVDTTCFPRLHAEITRGLAEVETSYTGGTLKWMGVCAPWVMTDPYRDAMDAIGAMSKSELAELVALGDEDQLGTGERGELAFGDETDRPFTKAQMRFLEQRHGVYFPWKVCYHLLENDRWEDKHSGDGKELSEEARAVFPETVAFVESLPFVEIGRVVVFGLLANDHAPAHRDSEPGKALAVAQSISFEPARAIPSDRQKRFYLATPDGSAETEVEAPIYWFNDMDWHGVKADPFFRYSVRVDGVFEPSFLDRVRRNATRRR